MTSSIIDNIQASRFEYAVNGHTCIANYRRDGDVLSILYVEAPPALRGTGAAGTLMHGIMKEVSAKGLKVRPVCGYAAAWLQKHREFHEFME